jgi:hypothetical protein
MSIVNGNLDELDEIGEVDEIDEIDELDEFEEEERDSKLQPANSNVGEISVEINVEDLIAEIEADSPPRPKCEDKPARTRLEELLEEKRAAREFGEEDEFD